MTAFWVSLGGGAGALIGTFATIWAKRKEAEATPASVLVGASMDVLGEVREMLAECREENQRLRADRDGH